MFVEKFVRTTAPRTNIRYAEPPYCLLMIVGHDRGVYLPWRREYLQLLWMQTNNFQQENSQFERIPATVK